jgi:twitching motility protein PilT
MMNKAIAKLIQSDQTHMVPSQMQMGRDQGMCLMDQSLMTAITAREVDPDDAYVYASEKKSFQKYVTDTSMLPKVDLTGPHSVAKPTSQAPA